MLHLIKNLIISLFNFQYLISFINYGFKLNIFYTIPSILLIYISGLSNNNIINNISYLISSIFFIYPALIFNTILVNIYLTNLFKKRYKIQKNPNNIYIIVLFIYIYLLNGVFYFLPIIYIPLNIFINSIYACEFSYNFVKKDKFYNKINLYNSNAFIFILYGIFCYIFLRNVTLIYLPISSFIIYSILFHGLINYPFKNTSNNITNYFLIFEITLNYLIEPSLKYINNKLINRKLIK
jgi:hypothetical protein